MKIVKGLTIFSLLIAATFNASAEEIYLGPSASLLNGSVTIDVKQLALLRDGKDPELVYKSLNELTYLARARNRDSLDTLFNTLITVIDNTETVVDCDQPHPRYDIKSLLAPLSRNAEIWVYLRKTDKKFCYRVQTVYQEHPWLYGSMYDNPSEADICGIMFKHQ